MAIYKPSNCQPFLNSIDLTKDQWLQCEINTSNMQVTGYKIRITDNNNDIIFEGINYDFVSTIEGNTGLNGSIFAVPFVVVATWGEEEESEDSPSNDNPSVTPNLINFNQILYSPYQINSQGIAQKNGGNYITGDYWHCLRGSEYVPVNNFNNNYLNQPYRWQITFTQGRDTQGNPTLGQPDLKWYDMLITTGIVMGSTPNRIQTKKYKGVQSDYFIELLNDNLSPVGSRQLILRKDSSFGYIYPREGGFSQQNIDDAEYFRIFRSSNDPEVVSASRKINYLANVPSEKSKGGWSVAIDEAARATGVGTYTITNLNVLPLNILNSVNNYYLQQTITFTGAGLGADSIANSFLSNLKSIIPQTGWYCVNDDLESQPLVAGEDLLLFVAEGYSEDWMNFYPQGDDVKEKLKNYKGSPYNGILSFAGVSAEKESPSNFKITVKWLRPSIARSIAAYLNQDWFVLSLSQNFGDYSLEADQSYVWGTTPLKFVPEKSVDLMLTNTNEEGANVSEIFTYGPVFKSQKTPKVQSLKLIVPDTVTGKVAVSSIYLYNTGFAQQYSEGLSRPPLSMSLTDGVYVSPQLNYLQGFSKGYIWGFTRDGGSFGYSPFYCSEAITNNSEGPFVLSERTIPFLLYSEIQNLANQTPASAKGEFPTILSDIFSMLENTTYTYDGTAPFIGLGNAVSDKDFSFVCTIKGKLANTGVALMADNNCFTIRFADLNRVDGNTALKIEFLSSTNNFNTQNIELLVPSWIFKTKNQFTIIRKKNTIVVSGGENRVHLLSFTPNRVWLGANVTGNISSIKRNELWPFFLAYDPLSGLSGNLPTPFMMPSYINYNNTIKNEETVFEATIGGVIETYIRPFIGLEEGMDFRYVDSLGLHDIPIQNLNTDNWSFYYPATEGLQPLSPDVQRYSIYSYFKQSDENPFYAYTTPTLSINFTRNVVEKNTPIGPSVPVGSGEGESFIPADGYTIEDYGEYVDNNSSDNQGIHLSDGVSPTWIVPFRFISMTGTYIQAQNKSWKNYYWTLEDFTLNTITTKAVSYSGAIEVYFDGLQNGHQYKVTLVLEDELGDTYSQSLNFTCELKNLGNGYFPLNLKFLCDLQAVDIDFVKSGKILLNYILNEEEGEYIQDINGLTVEEGDGYPYLEIKEASEWEGREFGTEYKYGELPIEQAGENTQNPITLLDGPQGNDVTFNSQHKLSPTFTGTIIYPEIELYPDQLENTKIGIQIEVPPVTIQKEGQTLINPLRNQFVATVYTRKTYDGQNWDNSDSQTIGENTPANYSLQVYTENGAPLISNSPLAWRKPAFIVYAWVQPEATVNNSYDYLDTTVVYDSVINKTQGGKTEEITTPGTVVQGYFHYLPNQLNSSTDFVSPIASTEKINGEYSTLWYDYKTPIAEQKDGTSLHVFQQEINNADYIVWNDDVIWNDTTVEDTGLYMPINVNEENNHNGRQLISNNWYVINMVLADFDPKERDPAASMNITIRIFQTQNSLNPAEA